ncbi:MAG: family 16 glycoside hydrolase [Terracidiphilus sp.]
MQRLSKIVLSAMAVIVLGLALAAGLAAWRWELGKRQGDDGAGLRGWQPIGGHWTERAGVLSNSNYGRGDMLIARQPEGTNYRIAADLRFDLLFSETHYGDAGLVIRTTDPEQGVDSYQGYYAGLRPDEQTVILGRASYEWRQLESAKLATPIAAGTWYHLELSAQGCRLTVTATPEGGRPATRIEHEDNQCLTKGVAGLRSFYAQASWRNVQIDAN